MPQSMHRAVCAFSAGSSYGTYTSRQSCTRSTTARVGCFWRWISRKPVALPMDDDLDLGRLGLAHDRAGEDSLVVPRHHFHERLHRAAPVAEQLTRAFAAGVLRVAREQRLDQLDVVRIERFEVDELGIAARRESAVRVQH